MPEQPRPAPRQQSPQEKSARANWGRYFLADRGRYHAALDRMMDVSTASIEAYRVGAETYGSWSEAVEAANHSGDEIELWDPNDEDWRTIRAARPEQPELAARAKVRKRARDEDRRARYHAALDRLMDRHAPAQDDAGFGEYLSNILGTLAGTFGNLALAPLNTEDD